MHLIFFDSTDHKKYYKTLSILLDQDIKEEKPKYISQSLFIEKTVKKNYLGKSYNLNQL